MGFVIVLDNGLWYFLRRNLSRLGNALGAGVSLGGKDITGALGNSSESSYRSEPVSGLL